MTFRHSHHKNGTLKSDHLNACFQFLKKKIGSLKTDNLNGPLEGDLIVEIIKVKPGLYISQKDRKHMVANMSFKLSTYVLVFT